MLICRKKLQTSTLEIGQVDLPYISVEGAKEAVLHVDFQYGEPCMWYDAIAPDLLTYKYLIVAVETGHFHDEEVLEKGKYIGTAMLLGGSLVLHYFLFEPCVLRKSTLITLAMDDFA